MKKNFSRKRIIISSYGYRNKFWKIFRKDGYISSLATLSFDKRRSEFFTKELFIILNLIDKKIIDPDILFGSWAGAFGNFQFMPRTIKNYAIDYNKNKTIELKKLKTHLHLQLII